MYIKHQSSRHTSTPFRVLHTVTGDRFWAPLLPFLIPIILKLLILQDIVYIDIFVIFVVQTEKMVENILRDLRKKL